MRQLAVNLAVKVYDPDKGFQGFGNVLQVGPNAAIVRLAKLWPAANRYSKDSEECPVILVGLEYVREIK